MQIQNDITLLFIPNVTIMNNSGGYCSNANFVNTVGSEAVNEIFGGLYQAVSEQKLLHHQIFLTIIYIYIPVYFLAAYLTMQPISTTL